MSNWQDWSEEKQLLRLEKLKFYAEAKSKPCTDCGGVFHREAMQFDHVETGKKLAISEFAWGAWPLERLVEEIALCVLVCANCHAVRAYNRRRGV